MRVLHINAVRVNSGGALVHLEKLLPLIDSLGLSWVIYLPVSHAERFSKYASNSRLLEMTTMQSLLWELKMSRDVFNKDNNVLLLNFDTGSLAYSRNTISVNHDLLCFDQFPEYKIHPRYKSLRLFLLYYVQLRCIKKSKLTVFLSHYTVSKILPIIKVLNFRVIGHGFPENVSTRECNLSNNAEHYVITYISGFDSYKNHDYLFEALGGINDIGKYKKLIINLVGGGSAKRINQLRRFTKDLDKKIDVKVFGFVNRVEVNTLLDYSDGLVFLSSCEAFGITALEMAAKNKPMYCSFRSTLPELFQDKIQYVNPCNPRDLRRAINDLINNRISPPKDLNMKLYDWAKMRVEYKKLLLEYAEV